MTCKGGWPSEPFSRGWPMSSYLCLISPYHLLCKVPPPAKVPFFLLCRPVCLRHVFPLLAPLVLLSLGTGVHLVPQSPAAVIPPLQSLFWSTYYLPVRRYLPHVLLLCSFAVSFCCSVVNGGFPSSLERRCPVPWGQCGQLREYT